MNICDKCLENNWKFNYNEGIIEATCQFCGNEVSFEAKKKVKLTSQCRKCNGALIKHKSKFKPSKLKKSYYYTAYYKCINCKTAYMAEEFKIINKS